MMPFQPRPTPNPRSVFQSKQFPRYVSVQEAREVHDICKRIMNHENRMATYEMFGMDGKHVEQYIDVVENLDTSWEKTEQFEKFLKSKYIRIGPFHFFIHIDWKN